MRSVKFSLVILASFIRFTSLAQDSTGRIKITPALNYNSHLNYFGRTDSTQSSGIYPSFEINFFQKLYLKPSVIFTFNNKSGARYNATIVEMGYLISPGKKVTGNIFYSQFLYNKQSVLVQSAVKSQAGINLSFLNEVIDCNVGADTKFSNKTDFGVTASLDHIFRMDKIWGNSIFVAAPYAAIYSGTQNFSKTYLEKQNLLFIPLGNEEVTKDEKKFNVLAYEAGLPLVWGVSGFEFNVTPTYIIPQHLVLVANRPDLSEHGTKLFYMTAGIKYTF
jgi:hypothetical protein